MRARADVIVLGAGMVGVSVALHPQRRGRDAVYHLSALPRIAPWLFQYWRNATPERVERSMRALAPLMAQCVKEHDVLIAEVGSAAQSLVNHRGWLNCCRTEKTLLKGIADAQTLKEYGVDYTVLTG